MLKKQKNTTRRTSLQDRKHLQLLQEYRASIAPVQFSLREVETFNSLSTVDLQNIEISTIEQDKLKEIVVDILKLSFIYDPLKETLNLSTPTYINHYQLKNIVKILFRGEFYRFIRNTENQLKILVNNRTTESNVKILIAALFIQGCRKLNLDQISTSLLFFALQATLNPVDQLCIPADSQKILKVLKKIERVIKPADFKIWFESVKTHKDFNGQIQAHHFLYLCSMTQKKFAQGFHHIILNPKISSLFKNLNTNVKMPDFEQAQLKQPSENKTKPKKRESFSFYKEILKEFRLRDPSKNKRPDTANLRSRVKSFCNIPEAARHRRDSSVQRNTQINKSITSKSLASAFLNPKFKKSNARLSKGPSKSNKKSQFKLKLKW